MDVVELDKLVFGLILVGLYSENSSLAGISRATLRVVKRLSSDRTQDPEKKDIH